jgi:hypothetical protein
VAYRQGADRVRHDIISDRDRARLRDFNVRSTGKFD